MELHRIKTVEPSGDFSLRLTYDDGCVVLADFSKLIQKGGVFATLGRRSFFGRVQVRNGGREVVWPGAIDFCADALRIQGTIQKRGHEKKARDRSNQKRQSKT